MSAEEKYAADNNSLWWASRKNILLIIVVFNEHWAANRKEKNSAGNSGLRWASRKNSCGLCLGKALVLSGVWHTDIPLAMSHIYLMHVSYYFLYFECLVLND